MLEPGDLGVGDASEHVGEPGLRIEVVEPGAHDQRRHQGGAIGAARSFERESRGARFYRSEGDLNVAAFELHQSVESAYSALLLTLTNSSPLRIT